MSKCPFCNADIHLQDFYEVYEKEKKGKIKTRLGDFKGEMFKGIVGQEIRMWACPVCEKVLGFSEHRWNRFD